MTSLKDLRLYTTVTHACSYLPERKAKTLFIDPEFIIATEFHTRLTEIGFRRSGSHIYRPHCPQCQSCIPCRILASEFRPNKRFRRNLKRNQDLQVRMLDSIDDTDCYLLYDKYINTRHRDGDMYPASLEQYRSFLVSRMPDTRYYGVYEQERLLAVMICDHLINGLSAVFTFYDPDAGSRSLGSFAILWQIAEARRTGLPYVYLGYWIKDCEKMNYKTQFRPIELLYPYGWRKLS